MRLPVTAAVLFAFATLQASFVHAATPITHVAIYRGPAGCDDCSESVKSALQRLSPNYQIDFVGADEPIDITPHTLARYDLYVQPGGGQDIPRPSTAWVRRALTPFATTSPRAGAIWGCAWARTWRITATLA